MPHIFGFSFFISTLNTTFQTWHQSAIFENSWPSFFQIWIIFTHFKWWIASAGHNFKWVQIQIGYFGGWRVNRKVAESTGFPLMYFLVSRHQFSPPICSLLSDYGCVQSYTLHFKSWDMHCCGDFHLIASGMKMTWTYKDIVSSVVILMRVFCLDIFL